MVPGLHSDLSKLFDLHGRVAIVTGGSRGLGRAMALGLAKAGASVVVASRKKDSCDAVVAEIEGLHVDAKALAVAVRMQEADDIKSLVNATVAEFGHLDIVINNAGTVLDRDLDGIEPATFIGALSTNLLGPLLLVQAARTHLAARGYGAVVNISSIAGFSGSRGRYLYPPAKAALAQVTKSLALDLAAEKIRVNAISPGTFRTDMVEKAFDTPMLDRIATGIPAGRIADPHEIVGPALLLVSDAGSFITGEVLTVDGGATA
jgi:NAD(P)-dependent dehydrogenase (short-subunit alcohol dehydrogenase family)